MKPILTRWELEQRVLSCGQSRDLSTNYLGQRHALPIVLAPVGFLGLYAGHGEALTAKAAKAAGVPLCLSTFSIQTLADLRTVVSDAVLYFQLYVLKDRALAEEFIEEARLAHVQALYITVDTNITAVRERDLRNGFRSLQRLTPGLLMRLMRNPGWCLDMWRAGMPEVGLLKKHPEFGHGVMAQSACLSQSIDTNLTWNDIEWLRERWTGKLVIKGVMAGRDAVRACERGADAVVISNHGGRQLDGVPSSISVLPEIVRAVGNRTDILFRWRNPPGNRYHQGVSAWCLRSRTRTCLYLRSGSGRGGGCQTGSGRARHRNGHFSRFDGDFLRR